jgi:GNAT superfamily N-acetyltransferase
MTAPPTTDIALRPAQEADVPAIVDVVQRAYRGEGGWTTEAHLVKGSRTHADDVRAMLADDAVTLIVAETTVGEDPTVRLVGCCYTHREPAEGESASRAELGLFAVDPAAQSRGLGGLLLETQAETLREAGVEVLMIRVLQSRPELHAWYERHGFARTGLAVPFPGDPARLVVEGLGMDVMERPLQSS